MAEVVAVAASVVAIIQITDRVVGLCKFYIDSIHDVPAGIRVISTEASALKGILEILETQRFAVSSTPTDIMRIFAQDGPVSGCHRTVVELEKLFASQHAEATKCRKLTAAKETLAWPFKSSKVHKLLDEMMRYKSSISLALTTEASQDTKIIMKHTAEIHSMLTDRQRQDVYSWLRHTDPSPLHYRAQKHYEPGTADWILRTSQWADWSAGKQRCLWIHGIPGAGKTVMLSHLIEQLKKISSQNTRKRCAFVYYYCFYGHNQDESKPFLKWLITRLCLEAEFVPAPLYQTSKEGSEPSSQTLLEALAELVPMFSKVYVAIDAIDESNDRSEMLGTIRTLCTHDRYRTIQVLTTSREYSDIERVMLGFSIPCSMDNIHVQEDIRVHVRAAIAANSRYSKWPRELLEEVEQKITVGAKGMFRWATCQIDVIQRLKPERGIIERAIRNLPKTLYETYDRVLLAVPEDERLFVVHALQWIVLHSQLLSNHPLPINILLRVTDKSVSAFAGINGNERFFDVDELKDLCGCLIEITSRASDDPPTDKDTSIALAHYTVAEYLMSSRKLGITANNALIRDGGPTRDTLQFLFTHALQSDTTWQGNLDFWDKCFSRTGSDFGNWDFMFYVVENFERSAELYCLLLSMKCEPKDGKIAGQRNSLRRLAGEVYITPEGFVALVVDFCIVVGDKRTRRQTCHLLDFHDFRADMIRLLQGFVQVEGFELLRWKAAPYSDSSWTEVSDEWHVSLLEQLLDLMINDENSNSRSLEIVATTFFDPLELLSISPRYADGEGTDAERRYAKLLKRLLRLGAVIDYEELEETPLQCAVKSRKLHAVRALLEAGALPNQIGKIQTTIHRPDGMGWTNVSSSPLELCRMQMEMIQMASQCSRQALENTPLRMIEKLLLQYGAK